MTMENVDPKKFITNIVVICFLVLNVTILYIMEYFDSSKATIINRVD